MRFLSTILVACLAWANLPTTLANASGGGGGGACMDTYHLYQAYNHPEKKILISEHGNRTLTVTEVSTGSCPTWSNFPTGSEAANCTVVSYDAGETASQRCQLSNTTGTTEWGSFQGLMVRADGWRIQPTEFELSDIDIEAGSDQKSALHKAALVLGFANGEPVAPRYTIPEGSLLRTEQFWLREAEMDALGLPPDEMFPEGLMWGRLAPDVDIATLVDCTEDQTMCRATVSFDEPIDGFVALFAGEHRSEFVAHAKMSLGPMKSPCGCRCERSPEGRTRMVTHPIADVPGECTHTESTSSHLYCVANGTRWCERGVRARHATIGSKLENGNYPCGMSHVPFAKREIGPFRG